jgi:hypothetical protein
MYTLLFFLPIYFVIIKQHSPLHTALLLLPQTLPILPCAFLVLSFAERNVPPSQVVLLGWFFTSFGVGLLSALDEENSVLCDVSVNTLCGLGIGVLLPSLTLSAKASIAQDKTLQAQTLLISLRYLGKALGLVVIGIVFQLVLKYNLLSTKFAGRAADMTKHATGLVYSVRKMKDAKDIAILINAVQATLKTIWIALAIACLSTFFLNCATVLLARRNRQREQSCCSEVAAETFG